MYSMPNGEQEQDPEGEASGGESGEWHSDEEEGEDEGKGFCFHICENDQWSMMNDCSGHAVARGSFAPCEGGEESGEGEMPGVRQRGGRRTPGRIVTSGQ